MVAKKKKASKPAPKSKARSAATGEAHRERESMRRRESSRSVRDIGPPPPVADPVRRERCSKSLKDFCETYLSATFDITWSPDHITAIDRLQTCVLEGGRFALAMMRGGGKSSLCEAACLWALVNGHRKFVVLIGSTEGAAEELLDSIKMELETNDLLASDYGEVCHPITALEGQTSRARGQHIGGVRTRLGWTQKQLVLPTVAGSVASGVIVRVAGLTGRIRGMKHKQPSGDSLRPDLVICDDPQTDESARKPLQNDYRERVLAGAVLGLAGPKKKIAAIVPTTVIAPGDLADRILDRDRHPEWHGERFQMMYSMPTDEKLWDHYANLRQESMRAGGNGSEATEFYIANREAMDAGAKPAWPERFEPGEVSAVQSAMNRKIDDPRSFMAEMQNAPLADLVLGLVDDLDADAICEKVNRVPRGVVPRDCSRLTAFIDVGGKVLFGCVVAWSGNFTGHVVDYGTFPKQNRAFFAADDARPSLLDQFPDYDETARVYGGLTAIVEKIVARPWRREGSGELRVERCLVDAGWLPDVVHQFCSQSPLAPILMPSKGFAVGAAGKPMSEWPIRPGEHCGLNWRVNPVTGGGFGRLCVFDPNFWKSFVATRLLSPPGSAGCMQLFGDGKGEHQLFATAFK